MAELLVPVPIGNMKMRRNKMARCGAAAQLLMLASPLFKSHEAVAASIITNLNFNRDLDAEYVEPPPFGSMQVPYESTSVPIQQAISANDGLGGSISTTYSVTSNESQAMISITSSGSVTQWNAISEGNGPGIDTSFNLATPAYYTATVTTTGPGGIGVGSQITESCFLDVVGDRFDFISNQSVFATQTFTGIAYPGLVDFGEDWGMSIEQAPVSGSGTNTVTMTFTAITPLPEPSSALLIGVPALALLARRRRPARQCNA